MDKCTEFPRLVDYSSDEETAHSNEDEEQALDTPNSELPPLPLEIQKMYGELSQTEIKDDPAKHGGKIRVFPHERGVWATYVYIEYNPEPEFFYMIEKLKNLSKFHGINFETSDSFHVSLSRTVKLRHHWIAPFIDSLRAHLCNFIKFKIMFQSLEVYENEEKTR
ncbi:U6 snRNA phosphodiesterase-like [Stegodyphus dumicola]|uniref:U6 snRNA phosphodiesterase-like n=1 Tax=Stegodyphus dumicola TaxID=202533 RepID=UPI0015B13CEC|nr:U6 snRNA phosphodiesterase-like [Stegodyphus dumicola]